MDSKSVQPSPDAKKVFVVHGHANDMKEAAARTFEKVGLEAVILDEQPSRNKTVIEKFELNAAVGFAIVLLSGDDMAYPVTIPHGEANARPRARQNVVLELGYFMGRLGRDRVFTLLKEVPNFEQPSDYHGVIYVPYDGAGAWRLALAKELANANYKIDVAALLGKTSGKEAELTGKVESPKEGAILPPGFSEVKGRVLNYSGQFLYVMTGRDDTYWPTGRIVPQADMTWSSRVNFGSRIDTHTIFLAAVDENTATLIDLYRRNAAAERQWAGVLIRPLKTVLARMSVRTSDESVP